MNRFLDHTYDGLDFLVLIASALVVGIIWYLLWRYWWLNEEEMRLPHGGYPSSNRDVSELRAPVTIGKSWFEAMTFNLSPNERKFPFRVHHEDMAGEIYKQAQVLDKWPEGDGYEGTSRIDLPGERSVVLKPLRRSGRFYDWEVDPEFEDVR